MSDSVDAYHLWLGIPPGEQPPTAYRLLGLRPLESDPEVIANAADRQTLHLRTFQLGEHAELSERLLNEVAAARVTLLNPAKKACYDRQLRAEAKPVAARPVTEPAVSSSAGPALLGVPRPVRPAPLRPVARRRRRLPRWVTPAIVVAVLVVALVILLGYTITFFFTSGRESAPPPEQAEPPAATNVLPLEPAEPPAAKSKSPIVIDSPRHRPPPSGPAGSHRKSP